MPAPRLRRAGRWLALLACAYPAELLWRGHLVAAAVVMLLAAGLGFCCRRQLGNGDAMPRRLVGTAAGDLFIVEPGLPARHALLHPASMRLGAHLLLVVQCEGRAFRFLLGPDNLAPHLLAQLQRRLPSA